MCPACSSGTPADVQRLVFSGMQLEDSNDLGGNAERNIPHLSPAPHHSLMHAFTFRIRDLPGRHSSHGSATEGDLSGMSDHASSRSPFFILVPICSSSVLVPVCSDFFSSSFICPPLCFLLSDESSSHHFEPVLRSGCCGRARKPVCAEALQ